MMKRIICFILISVLLIHVYGCYSNFPINKENLNHYVNNKINIVTSDRKEYNSESNFWNTKNDTLFITVNDSTKNETTQRIPYSSIKLIYANQFDLAKTILLGIGISIVAVIIIGAISLMNKPLLDFSGLRFD